VSEMEAEPEIPNPFKGIASAAIDSSDPIAFMVDYGWNDEETLETKMHENERQMLQEMWDVSHAQGRAYGQQEAAQAMRERVKTRDEKLEALTKEKEELDTVMVTRVRDLQEMLQTERDRCQSAVTALEITSKQVEELKDQLKAERAERKIGFRIWWHLNSLAAAAFRASSGKVASYTAD